MMRDTIFCFIKEIFMFKSSHKDGGGFMKSKLFFLFLLVMSLMLQIGIMNSLAVEGDENNKETEMKVNFYAIDTEKLGKGEFLGTAELRDGELYVDVTDTNLKRLLKSPYKTMRPEKKRLSSGKSGERNFVMLSDKFVTLKPGTEEHLKAIAIGCWRYGYIGEIVKK